jgi:hypothetical protein
LSADPTTVPGPITSTEQLARVVEVLEADITACHALLTTRLRAAGDRTSAALLDAMADEAAVHTSAQIPDQCALEECRAREPLALLVAAQRPLERLCEVLETAYLASPDTQLQAAVEDALSRSVSRISRIGRRIEALETTPKPGR